MDENTAFVVFGFSTFGLLALGVGIWARLGHLRGLYLFRGIPGLHPAGYIYGFLPIGIAGLLIAFTASLSNKVLIEDIIVYGVGSLVLLFILLMIWKPRWLKPWWLKWLEDNYGKVLERMLEEARNTKDFEQQTQTEDELAAWADRVARKQSW